MLVSPFIHICPLEEGLKAASVFKFRPSQLHAYKLPNGFIAVRFGWHSEGGMKYARKETTFAGFGDNIGFILAFEDVLFNYLDETDTTKIPFSFEIGIKGADSTNFSPLFIQNLKYEVMAYFAPKNWAGSSENWDMFHSESLDIKDE